VQHVFRLYTDIWVGLIVEGLLQESDSCICKPTPTHSCSYNQPNKYLCRDPWVRHRFPNIFRKCCGASVRPSGRRVFWVCALPAQQAYSPLPSLMASPKKKRQRHFPTRTTVAAFPTARPPLAFSSAVPACHGILQHGDASPRAQHPPAATFSCAARGHTCPTAAAAPPLRK
jgi:hypothetical protein